MTSLPLRLAEARAPRYTSYPTAPHFHEGVDGSLYRDWLAALPEEAPLSLYLHVPFCHQLCWYCGCHTAVANNYQRIAAYVGLLQREIDLLGDALGRGRPVSGLHWGGGTPSILSAADFGSVMDKLAETFDFQPDAELAIEIDPRHLTAEKAQAMAASGINRASLGVQDFNPHVQVAINRIQPFETTAEAAHRLRFAGIDAINFDLMYGLPHQGLNDVKQTACLAADLRPDRISVFGYAHVPWMKKHQKMIDPATLPGAEARVAQAELAECVLALNGYRAIGLDHFALPGDPLFRAAAEGRLHRNFQGYTTDQAAVLLGLGVSSIGSLPQGYAQNEKDIVAYARALRAGRLPVVRGIAVTAEDSLRRDIIERLMCDFAVDLDAAARKHGLTGFDFSEDLERLAPFVDDGLVLTGGSRLRVTGEGKQALRLIAACFDAYLGAGARHSQAV
ncbi:oxygen-independent coproporphyrinogen III oxidase [Pelagibius litoralis]|uniref:Coproporphyrinogen-III oxidase n=1 Tax=Pelagibius litoralis TaxID=374515 RepID=A0A967KG48_9PROT|nr:oxygen-independent coproporphyrinogen III oxidase [Pelagibius litoralis]NIA71820.1 oxygen-independent coproporphyrinogen III oxidase [Pelagibius litoralis]